jgi:hypothetical protein
MADSVRKDAVLWYGSAAVCLLVVLLVVAGCSMMAKQDSQNAGGSGGGGGGGNGNSGSAAGSMQPVFFSLICSYQVVTRQTSEPATTTIKVSGDVPLKVDQDVLTLAKEPVPIFYSNDLDGGPGARLDLNAEYDLLCTPGEQDCTPCHYSYSGPVLVGVTIRHDPPKDPADWTLVLDDSADTFSNLDLNHELDRYVTVKEPSSDRCDPAGIKDLVVTAVITQTENCWGSPETRPVPLTYGDGQEVIFTSTDPEVTLDSKAVLHFGTPAQTPTRTKGPKIITIVTTATPEPTVSLAPLVTTEPTLGVLNPVNP